MFFKKRKTIEKSVSFFTFFFAVFCCRRERLHESAENISKTKFFQREKVSDEETRERFLLNCVISHHIIAVEREIERELLLNTDKCNSCWHFKSSFKLLNVKLNCSLDTTFIMFLALRSIWGFRIYHPLFDSLQLLWNVSGCGHFNMLS